MRRYRRKEIVEGFRIGQIEPYPDWFLKSIEQERFTIVDDVKRVYKNNSPVGKEFAEPGDGVVINSEGSIFVFSFEAFESMFEEIHE